MKKVLLGILVVVVVVVIGGFIFQEPLKQAAYEKVTQDMFVATDADAFDPGIAIGSSFPSVQATVEGQVVTDASQYAGPNGIVFVANRSVDW